METQMARDPRINEQAARLGRQRRRRAAATLAAETSGTADGTSSAAAEGAAIAEAIGADPALRGQEEDARVRR
ncbi:hypothetical protein A6452_38955 [Bradyrhizobium elkanii]|nr:hypothetical protein A6452_38955 [Bradyrhizobium elkanii]